MGSFGNFVAGFVVGAVVGVAVVVFTTPKSGDQTRTDLATLWNNAISTGKRVAQQREDELWAEFNSRAAQTPGPAPLV
jgi:gas vesicle protein